MKTEINPKELNDNFFKAIGEEWMLVAAGNKDKFNMMTASWGGTGIMWGKPVVFVFIRPERYTREFMDQERISPFHSWAIIRKCIRFAALSRDVTLIKLPKLVLLLALEKVVFLVLRNHV